MKRSSFLLVLSAIYLVLLMIQPSAVLAEQIAADRASDEISVRIDPEVIVARQPGRYIGWPSIAATEDGELLAVFSGDRDWHLCPWGKIFLTRSSDGGETWSDPVIAVDTPLDDRDAGILVAPDGSLLITFNASLVFDMPEKYPQYQDYARSLDAETREKWEHQWVFRSTDGGKTFTPQGPVPTGTPHGPAVLADGRLLMVRTEVYESHDLGKTWNKIAEIPQPEDWKSSNAFMSESHAVETDDGRIVALARYRDKKTPDYNLRQLESSDGGHTWSAITATGMEGFPPHLLKLDNGWLVASYARRVAPLGQRVCVSMDHGRTWKVQDEVELSNAIPQSPIDLGYPASAQLPDGSIYTVYYQVADASHDEMPSLMGTLWRLSE